MSKLNWFDEAARVLAMPIPRRKALKHVAAGFAGALLPFLWPERAAAVDIDKSCGAFPPSGCIAKNFCYGHVDDPCTVNGQAGHCVQICRTNTSSRAVCTCVPGPAPDAPAISAIPDVIITREASLAAGNCQEGTDWVASWFPGRDSVSAREAAAAAIARGKPRLARYIAYTAQVVHRGAQA
jgi:hypothetical protein